MKQSSPIDWLCLTTEGEKEIENIYLHELAEGHQLVNILAGIRHAKAAVLINTTNSYELAEEFVTGIEEVRFPVVIITRKDGSDVLNYTSCNTSILACLGAESDVDDIQPEQIELEHANAQNFPSNQAKTGETLAKSLSHSK